MSKGFALNPSKQILRPSKLKNPFNPFIHVQPLEGPHASLE